MTLALMPERALLNDVNPHLINFYRQVKRGLRVTIDAVNDEGVFYSNRRRFNELIKAGETDSPEAAQHFYYLNRTGYNGLCRFNRSGLYNVPFGSYQKINYASDFLQYRPVFRRWLFTNADFEQLEIKRTDFIYADPPYDVDFRSYSAGGFTWEDQVRTAEWLSKQSVPVVLSNQATPRIVQLYTRLGFGLRYLDAPRRISCNGDRAAVKEVLAVKGV